MSLIIGRPDNERAAWMLKALEDAETLTDWEMEFCDDLRGKMTRTGGLSDKQFDKLEQIYRDRA